MTQVSKVEKEKALEALRLLRTAYVESGKLDSAVVTREKDLDVRKKVIRTKSRQVAKSKSPVIELRIEKKGSVELTATTTSAIMNVLGKVASGKRFRIVELENEISTQEAADILNVSRPYLIKLLDQGKIDFRKVGKHRRVNQDSLLEFKDRNKKARSKALDELAKQAQKLDMGY